MKKNSKAIDKHFQFNGVKYTYFIIIESRQQGFYITSLLLLFTVHNLGYAYFLKRFLALWQCSLVLSQGESLAIAVHTRFLAPTPTLLTRLCISLFRMIFLSSFIIVSHFATRFHLCQNFCAQYALRGNRKYQVYASYGYRRFLNSKCYQFSANLAEISEAL